MKLIEILTRVVILERSRILLCRIKGRKWYFLPGGHVELGETTAQALRREVKEELNLSIRNPSLIGVIENFYQGAKSRHHEINLIFTTELRGHGNKSAEGHIEFEWRSVKSLPKTKILPPILKKCLRCWLKDKKLFWASQS